MGGNVEDDVGCYLVESFINNFLSVPKRYKPFLKNEKEIVDFIKNIQPSDTMTRMCDGNFVLGVELELILKESIRTTMPKIWVNKHRPIIAGAIIFLEPLKNKFGLEQMCVLMPPFGSEDRTRFIKEWAKSSAYGIIKKHKPNRFEHEIRIDSGGSGLTMEAAQW